MRISNFIQKQLNNFSIHYRIITNSQKDLINIVKSNFNSSSILVMDSLELYDMIYVTKNRTVLDVYVNDIDNMTQLRLMAPDSCQFKKIKS